MISRNYVLKKNVAKIFLTVLLMLFSIATYAMNFSQYKKRPKLIVVLVIDQFRADFLRKFQGTFVEAKKGNIYGGFNYLMENSAFYPTAEYDILQSMTCPGHSMIMSGAYPSDSGIVLNEWYDKKLDKKITCVFDEKFKLSPNHLLTTTIGDELKNVDKNSRVFALSLKDRSSIMLGGHRADLAIWVDNDEMKWTTSSFYAEKLPGWAEEENKRLISEYKISKENSKEAKKDFATYMGVKASTDMAVRILNDEKLGMGNSTDILAISFSTHDMVGHSNGADSLEIKAITHVEDRQIARLINAVNKQLGSLKDVVFVLTGDHGIAPNIETSLAHKIDSGKIDYAVVYKVVNDHMNEKFGKINGNWIKNHRSFHLYLDDEKLKSKSIALESAENEVKKALQSIHGIKNVATSDEISRGIYPIGESAEQLKKQYLPGRSGDLVIIPQAFYMEKDDNCVTHMTGYSYDRSVPLLISGPHINPGIYSGAKIIDLAPTLAHLLHILPPSSNSGKVLPIFK